MGGDGWEKGNRTVYLSAPAGDRYPEASWEFANGAFLVFPECSDVFGDHCDLRLLCKEEGKKKRRTIGSDRIGLDCPPEGRTFGRAARPDWSVGPNGPNFWAWAGPAKETELGRGPLTKGGRDRGTAAATASERRFSPLDAAMKAGMDAKDSSGHRQHSAVVDRDLTGG
ncbi:hypothetical protein CRG98_008891 [Punica granatum]|uniref:Uncharacterized protein n=1 Tax=Punica granatum TaxID=22663 RepID=A0A2I0KQ88_PUNGR|nr:hypothetical protein CRG98_008891 [Punica granatum]